MSVFHLNDIYYCTKDRNKTISGLLNDRKVMFSKFSLRKDSGIKNVEMPSQLNCGGKLY